MKANPAAPRDSILSILDWEEAWRRERPFPFTPSVSEINGLDAALDLYLAEGPEQVWARHALTAAACRAGVLAMGLSLWPADVRTASPTTTAVRIPAGLEDAAIRAMARERYGVVFSSGRGETQGKLVRIGHMGPTARPLYALVAVSALGGAMRALGHPLDVAAGMAATLAASMRAPNGSGSPAGRSL
jgi:pyridoxamine---pyruvate transaminase